LFYGHDYGKILNLVAKRRNKFFFMPRTYQILYFSQTRKFFSVEADAIRHPKDKTKIKNLKYKQVVNIVEDRKINTN
jgi:hypothetical protein